MRSKMSSKMGSKMGHFRVPESSVSPRRNPQFHKPVLAREREARLLWRVLETSGCMVEVCPRAGGASFYTIDANSTALGASNRTSEVRPRVVEAGFCIIAMLSRAERSSSGDLVASGAVLQASESVLQTLQGRERKRDRERKR